MRLFRAFGAALAVGLSLAVSGAGAAATEWRITKDHWDAADEEGFGRLVTAFGESTCSDPETCFESAANPYRDSDPPDLILNGDCADFIFHLRAYYAWKNGLPFSYPLFVVGRNGPNEDVRFSPEGNQITSRLQLAWQEEVDPVDLLINIGDTVSTAMFRIDASFDRGFNAGDFYPPKIERGAIRPGTAIYDINGHVVYVYKITSDGKIHFVDSNPDRTVTRGVYGPHIPREAPQLGAGFLNFRPIRLIGAVKQPDGSLRGGRFVLATNKQIADFSLEQYYGTEPNPTKDWRAAKFSVDGETMPFVPFVERRMKRTTTETAAAR